MATVTEQMQGKEPVRVDLNNVAHWFYAVNDRAEWNLREDFPCMLPPWESAMWKFTLPRIHNNEGKITVLPTSLDIEVATVTLPASNSDVVGDAPVGIMRGLIYSFGGTGEFPVLPGDDNNILEGKQIALQDIKERECKYLSMHSVNFTHYGQQLAAIIYFIFLDEMGKMIGYPMIFPSPGMVEMGEGVAGDCSALYPVVYAISLLHCKNISIRDKPVTRQVRRAKERKGEPVIIYKELVIDAFKEQVRSERQPGENEIHRALHICRGHFATYTEDKPLFGRITGTFWKPMHVRGKQEVGEVRKSYKVTR